MRLLKAQVAWVCMRKVSLVKVLLQAVGLYRAGFVAEYLAGIGARDVSGGRRSMLVLTRS